MKKLLKDLFTGADNTTFDLGRMLGFLLSCPVLGAGIMAIIRDKFDFLAYGGGVAALMGGIGALLWAKRSTEPTQVTAVATDATGRTASSVITTGAPDPGA